MLTTGFRASIVHFIKAPDPMDSAIDLSLQYYEDGLLLIKNGYTVDVGDYSTLVRKHGQPHKLVDYSGSLITPGFVDPHLHYPQLGIIASYGKTLLSWLTEYTFPEERKFSSPIFAEKISELFLKELWRHGVTTCASYATIHKSSVDALFAAALKNNMRIVCGKVMMDRNCPDYLAEDPMKSYEESLELINSWRGRGRVTYAITPRFAPTSSEKLLKYAGDLYEQNTDCLLQTHLAETEQECQWVLDIFKNHKSYLNVYDHYGLVGSRSIFGHAIHLNATELAYLAAKQSKIAFCPTSNLFLGSGLFDLKAATDAGIKVGIASDIGGGNSLSTFRTLAAAYAICQLKGHSLSPLLSLYHMTLGGAEVLGLEDKIGNFIPGKEADFVVLNNNQQPLLHHRTESGNGTLSDQLFALFMLGDDRNIRATYLMGKQIYTTEIPFVSKETIAKTQ